jgi:hypothetical protein
VRPHGILDGGHDLGIRYAERVDVRPGQETKPQPVTGRAGEIPATGG